MMTPGAALVMKKDHLKQVASSSGEYIHNNSSDAMFIDTGTCSKLYMRIIQSLEDPDLSAQLQPCCTACGHRGSVTDAKYLRQNKYLITDLLQKLKCIQCGSKEVALKIISSEAMPNWTDRTQLSFRIV